MKLGQTLNFLAISLLFTACGNLRKDDAKDTPKPDANGKGSSNSVGELRLIADSEEDCEKKYGRIADEVEFRLNDGLCVYIGKHASLPVLMNKQDCLDRRMQISNTLSDDIAVCWTKDKAIVDDRDGHRDFNEYDGGTGGGGFVGDMPTPMPDSLLIPPMPPEKDKTFAPREELSAESILGVKIFDRTVVVAFEIGLCFPPNDIVLNLSIGDNGMLQGSVSYGQAAGENAVTKDGAILCSPDGSGTFVAKELLPEGVEAPKQIAIGGFKFDILAHDAVVNRDPAECVVNHFVFTSECAKTVDSVEKKAVDGIEPKQPKTIDATEEEPTDHGGLALN